MVAFLLENGCNPSAKKSSSVGGSTPLQMAMTKGYNEIVVLLKKYGVAQEQQKQQQQTSDGTSSLMSFLDDVPEQFKPKMENIRKAQEGSIAKHHEYNTAALNDPRSYLNQDTASPVEEPWKTVRLFLSSTFGSVVVLRFLSDNSGYVCGERLPCEEYHSSASKTMCGTTIAPRGD